MKKIIFGTILLALLFVLPVPAMARVDVNVNISLPPPILFSGPPEMVVLPETYIYVVPDLDAEIFFWGGWWWRPWQGRWYRSHYYNSGWGYYGGIPSFYSGIPSGWRNDYRQHRWGGREWNYQRIPQRQVQRNWKGWEKNKHWEKQNTWGVKDLKPQTRTRQPFEAVQLKPKAKPQSRDIQQQKFQPQSQPVKRQVRETVKPQQFQPQSQPVKKQVREPQTRDFQQQSKPQTRDIQKQQLPQTRQLQQQQRTKSQPVKKQVRRTEKPQQSENGQGKPERGQGEKPR
jgi:hypothetical protein